MASTAAEVGAQAQRKVKVGKPAGGGRKWAAIGFLAPACVALGAIVVYPTLDTIAQSFQSDIAREFVGLDNYKEMISSPRITTALRNQVIWVVTAPLIITGLGLILAVLTERVKYSTAIKVILFLPMAISMVASGVMWRLAYEEDPATGFINGIIGKAVDVAGAEGAYPSATILPDAPLTKAAGGAIATKGQLDAGETATIGMVGMTEPAGARPAEAPEAPADGLGVLVWRDFRPGGGTTGEVDQGELGLPGATVEVLDASGQVVASGATAADGSVTFGGLGDGPFRAQVAASTFARGFDGIQFLGPVLVTPSLIAVFVWIQLGFAIVVIGSGLSALPRDLLEAARVDGATESQVFRFITFPLLRPVLGVVFVTLLINVLKIFDIVLITAPLSVQDDGNVIALEMFRSAFAARDFGVGAAIAVFLFLLLVPIMAFNVRRFRREQ